MYGGGGGGDGDGGGADTNRGGKDLLTYGGSGEGD